MKKVLLIDNYDSFTFNLAQLLKESRLCTYKIMKNDEVKLDEISEFDHILISPGPGLPKETVNLFDILERYGPTRSILGICLGMQAVAEFYGAELYNLETVYHGFITKTKIIDRSDTLFYDLPDTIETGLYHSWAIKNNLKTPALIITAVSEQNIIMGIKHKKYDIKGLQFHPESFMTPLGDIIIKNWLL
jgi:anthranilate synthase component II